MQVTRKRIIAAAISLIETEGVAAVTMPRLAAELGCGLMSLYGHVSSRDALLDTVAADLIARIEVPAAPGASWPGVLRSHARAIRQVAAAHPRTALLAAARAPAVPALLRLAHSTLAALETAGFTGPDPVRVLRTLGAYVLGSLLRGDAGAAGSVTGTAQQADADFEFGLDLLVQAVAHGQREGCGVAAGPRQPSR